MIALRTDLVQDFLERMDPRSSKGSAEVGARSYPLAPASDPAHDSIVAPPQYLDAPTDAEVQASWEQTIMPDFDEYDGSCGCGDAECAGAC